MHRLIIITTKIACVCIMEEVGGGGEHASLKVATHCPTTAPDVQGLLPKIMLSQSTTIYTIDSKLLMNIMYYIKQEGNPPPPPHTSPSRALGRDPVYKRPIVSPQEGGDTWILFILFSATVCVLGPLP